MTRVLIVDDHDLVRTGISMILESEPGMQVIGECEDGTQALDMIRQHAPDVVLMDVNMPGIGGVEATRRICQMPIPTRVIVLTVMADQPFPKRLLDAGASGYLTKGCGRDELLKAIRSVASGRRYIGNDIAQKLALSMLPGHSASPLEELSDREMAVLLMLVHGKHPQYIGDQLNISPKTVSTYKYRIFEKLAVENDVALMHLAIRHGLLEEPLTSS